MSDPFSVAGSAVGVISLGITVCDGLVKFVDQIKHRKGELLKLEAWMDQLADLLEELQSITVKVKQSSSITSNSVDTSITSIATVLEDLRSKLALSSKNYGNSNLTQRLREWKRNLTYPFKRDELLHLKSTVEGLHLNLILALQALQL